MNFLNHIFASKWAIDREIGLAALAAIRRASAGAPIAPGALAAMLDSRARRSVARAAEGEPGKVGVGVGVGVGGEPVAMEDEGETRRRSAMEVSRPWDGVLMHRSEQERGLGYYMQDGVAVVPVEGVLSRYASLINDSSQPRGTSSEAVIRSLRAAEANPDAVGMVLLVDSPGGTVAGTEEMAQAVQRAGKPVVAYAAYLMCSAAYWVGSQAREIVAAETSLVGNIGVYQVLHDTSAAAAAEGVKVHVVKAGAFKAIGVDGAPISEKQLEVVQEEINAVYRTFVSAVAAGRKGLSASQVITLADGRAHAGRDAVTLKLADRVGSLGDAVARVKALSA